MWGSDELGILPLVVFLALGAIPIVVAVCNLLVGGWQSRKKAGRLLLDPVHVKPALVPPEVPRWLRFSRRVKVAFFALLYLWLIWVAWSSHDLYLIWFGFIYPALFIVVFRILHHFSTLQLRKHGVILAGQQFKSWDEVQWCRWRTRPEYEQLTLQTADRFRLDFGVDAKVRLPIDRVMREHGVRVMEYETSGKSSERSELAASSSSPGAG